MEAQASVTAPTAAGDAVAALMGLGVAEVQARRVVDQAAARLGEAPALAVEDFLRAGLAAGRGQDALRGAAGFGPQRADVVIEDFSTGRAAALSSTGQQKAMLIGIVLGHAALIAAARGAAPLLLLDEPLVHLDEAHRAALFAALGRLNVQAILTGTDAAPFEPLAAAYYTVTGGRIELRA